MLARGGSRPHSFGIRYALFHLPNRCGRSLLGESLSSAMECHASGTEALEAALDSRPVTTWAKGASMKNSAQMVDLRTMCGGCSYLATRG